MFKLSRWIGAPATRRHYKMFGPTHCIFMFNLSNHITLFLFLFLFSFVIWFCESIFFFYNSETGNRGQPTNLTRSTALHVFLRFNVSPGGHTGFRNRVRIGIVTPSNPLVHHHHVVFVSQSLLGNSHVRSKNTAIDVID